MSCDAQGEVNTASPEPPSCLIHHVSNTNRVLRLKSYFLLCLRDSVYGDLSDAAWKGGLRLFLVGYLCREWMTPSDESRFCLDEKGDKNC